MTTDESDTLAIDDTFILVPAEFVDKCRQPIATAKPSLNHAIVRCRNAMRYILPNDQVQNTEIRRTVAFCAGVSKTYMT